MHIALVQVWFLIPSETCNGILELCVLLYCRKMLPYCSYYNLCLDINFAKEHTKRRVEWVCCMVHGAILIVLTWPELWMNCCYHRKCDESTWAVEAQLTLPKRWMNKELQYKFYVCVGKDTGKNYEHITQNWGINANRCLIPSKSYNFSQKGE